MRSPILLLTTLLLLLGAWVRVPAQEPPPPWAGYPSWKPRLKEPVKMGVQVMELCRAVTPDERRRRDQDPHFAYYAQVYVNPTGQATWQKLAQGKRVPAGFPVGTVLVKEKLAAPKSKQPELLTVMVKHASGYDPQHHDWEYVVVDGAGKTVAERGKLARCQQCHDKQNKTDGVISVTWHHFLTAKG